jgi:TrmH family RNA methyltransferase
VKRITSRDNPQYRELWRLAHSAKARREQGRTLLDGVHLVQAYAAAFGIDGVQLILRASAVDHPEIAALVEVPGAAAPLALADALFDGLSPVERPVGVMAAISIRPGIAPKRVQDGFSVFLDGVQDPGNLGSILRSAAAAGAKQVALSARCADAWSPKCLRGGMGAQFHLAINERVDLEAAMQTFMGRLVATDGAVPRSLYEVDLSGPVGFILGAEGAGISESLKTRADVQVRIPMEQGIESLNVAAAAAIQFYEWRRRNLA